MDEASISPSEKRNELFASHSFSESFALPQAKTDHKGQHHALYALPSPSQSRSRRTSDIFYDEFGGDRFENKIRSAQKQLSLSSSSGHLSSPLPAPTTTALSLQFAKEDPLWIEKIACDGEVQRLRADSLGVELEVTRNAFTALCDDMRTETQKGIECHAELQAERQAKKQLRTDLDQSRRREWAVVTRAIRELRMAQPLATSQRHKDMLLHLERVALENSGGGCSSEDVAGIEPEDVTSYQNGKATQSEDIWQSLEKAEDLLPAALCEDWYDAEDGGALFSPQPSQDFVDHQQIPSQQRLSCQDATVQCILLEENPCEAGINDLQLQRLPEVHDATVQCALCEENHGKASITSCYDDSPVHSRSDFRDAAMQRAVQGENLDKGGIASPMKDAACCELDTARKESGIALQREEAICCELDAAKRECVMPGIDLQHEEILCCELDAARRECVMFAQTVDFQQTALHHASNKLESESSQCASLLSFVDERCADLCRVSEAVSEEEVDKCAQVELLCSELKNEQTGNEELEQRIQKLGAQEEAARRNEQQILRELAQAHAYAGETARTQQQCSVLLAAIESKRGDNAAAETVAIRHTSESTHPPEFRAVSSSGQLEVTNEEAEIARKLKIELQSWMVAQRSEKEAFVKARNAEEHYSALYNASDAKFCEAEELQLRWEALSSVFAVERTELEECVQDLHLGISSEAKTCKELTMTLESQDVKHRRALNAMLEQRDELTFALDAESKVVANLELQSKRRRSQLEDVTQAFMQSQEEVALDSSEALSAQSLAMEREEVQVEQLSSQLKDEQKARDELTLALDRESKVVANLEIQSKRRRSQLEDVTQAYMQSQEAAALDSSEALNAESLAMERAEVQVEQLSSQLKDEQKARDDLTLALDRESKVAANLEVKSKRRRSQLEDVTQAYMVSQEEAALDSSEALSAQSAALANAEAQVARLRLQLEDERRSCMEFQAAVVDAKAEAQSGQSVAVESAKAQARLTAQLEEEERYCSAQLQAAAVVANSQGENLHAQLLTEEKSCVQLQAALDGRKRRYGIDLERLEEQLCAAQKKVEEQAITIQLGEQDQAEACAQRSDAQLSLGRALEEQEALKEETKRLANTNEGLMKRFQQACQAEQSQEQMASILTEELEASTQRQVSLANEVSLRASEHAACLQEISMLLDSRAVALRDCTDALDCVQQTRDAECEQQKIIRDLQEELNEVSPSKHAACLQEISMLLDSKAVALRDCTEALDCVQQTRDAECAQQKTIRDLQEELNAVSLKEHASSCAAEIATRSIESRISQDFAAELEIERGIRLKQANELQELNAVRLQEEKRTLEAENRTQQLAAEFQEIALERDTYLRLGRSLIEPSVRESPALQAGVQKKHFHMDAQEKLQKVDAEFRTACTQLEKRLSLERTASSSSKEESPDRFTNFSTPVKSSRKKPVPSLTRGTLLSAVDASEDETAPSGRLRQDATKAEADETSLVHTSSGADADADAGAGTGAQGVPWLVHHTWAPSMDTVDMSLQDRPKEVVDGLYQLSKNAETSAPDFGPTSGLLQAYRNFSREFDAIQSSWEKRFGSSEDMDATSEASGANTSSNRDDFLPTSSSRDTGTPGRLSPSHTESFTFERYMDASFKSHLHMRNEDHDDSLSNMRSSVGKSNEDHDDSLSTMRSSVGNRWARWSDKSFLHAKETPEATSGRLRPDVGSHGDTLPTPQRAPFWVVSPLATSSIAAATGSDDDEIPTARHRPFQPQPVASSWQRSGAAAHSATALPNWITARAQNVGSHRFEDQAKTSSSGLSEARPGVSSSSANSFSLRAYC